MPTPLESCPLPPSAEPGIGVFSMLRGKLNPPLSKSLHRSHTAWVVKLLSSLSTTAAVQFEYPAQKPGFIAASKNACLGREFRNAVYAAGLVFALGTFAPHASVEMLQPRAVSMAA